MDKIAGEITKYIGGDESYYGDRDYVYDSRLIGTIASYAKYDDDMMMSIAFTGGITHFGEVYIRALPHTKTMLMERFVRELESGELDLGELGCSKYGSRYDARGETRVEMDVAWRFAKIGASGPVMALLGGCEDPCSNRVVNVFLIRRCGMDIVFAEAIKELYDNGFLWEVGKLDVNEFVFSMGWGDEFGLLYKYATKGSVDKFKRLVVNTNEKDWFLHRAISSGNIEIADWIHDKGFACKIHYTITKIDVMNWVCKNIDYMCRFGYSLQRNVLLISGIEQVLSSGCFGISDTKMLYDVGYYNNKRYIGYKSLKWLSLTGGQVVDNRVYEGIFRNTWVIDRVDFIPDSLHKKLEVALRNYIFSIKDGCKTRMKLEDLLDKLSDEEI